MREGWEYKKLKEVCSFMSGYTPKKEELNEQAGIPYFKVSDMNRDENEYEMHNTELFVKNPKKTYPAGAIIFPKNGGAIYTEKKRFLICESVIDLNTEAVIANSDYILKEYLFYLLSKIKISSFDNGGGLPSVNIKKMSEYEICLPPLSEQQEIVDYLDTAFAKIDAMKANAEKALEEGKALFQSALKQLLEPKEGWEEKNLVKELKLKSGDYLSAKMMQEGNIPVYGGNGIAGYHNNANTTGEQVLIGRVGALCGNVHYTNTDIWVTDNAFIVNGADFTWNKKFLAYELDYLNLNQYASQTAQPVISNKSMKDVIISKPPLSDQQTIVTTLDSIKSKVDQLQENYDKIVKECDTLKQAILRQVFE